MGCHPLAKSVLRTLLTVDRNPKLLYVCVQATTLNNRGTAGESDTAAFKVCCNRWIPPDLQPRRQDRTGRNQRSPTTTDPPKIITEQSKTLSTSSSEYLFAPALRIPYIRCTRSPQENTYANSQLGRLSQTVHTFLIIFSDRFKKWSAAANAKASGASQLHCIWLCRQHQLSAVFRQHSLSHCVHASGVMLAHTTRHMAPVPQMHLSTT